MRETRGGIMAKLARSGRNGKAAKPATPRPDRLRFPPPVFPKTRSGKGTGRPDTRRIGRRPGIRHTRAYDPVDAIPWNDARFGEVAEVARLRERPKSPTRGEFGRLAPSSLRRLPLLVVQVPVIRQVRDASVAAGRGAPGGFVRQIGCDRPKLARRASAEVFGEPV